VYSFRIYRTTCFVTTKIVMITIMAYIPMAGMMNITSPVVYTYEGMVLLTVLGTVVSWYTVRQQELESGGVRSVQLN